MWNDDGRFQNGRSRGGFGYEKGRFFVFLVGNGLGFGFECRRGGGRCGLEKRERGRETWKSL